jgi:hypothetical protein
MSRRAAINSVLSVAGVALLVWQVQQVGGLAEVRRGLSSVGAGFGVVLVLSLLRFAMRAYAWRALIAERTPLAAAVAATISGDALGNLTPLGLAASEPAKAVYLGRSVDRGRAFAALTAENFFYSVSVAVYVIVGAAAMLWAFHQLPPAVRMGGIWSLVLMAGVLAAAGWIAWQRPALASGLLARLPPSVATRFADRVRDLERHSYGSATHEGTRLVRMALAETTFHVLSFAEAWVVLWLLSGGASLPLEALVLDTVSRVINVVFKLVPLRLGVDEVSSEVVAVAIGLPPGRGLLVALVRKIRMIVWAAAGLGLWAARR